MTYRRRRSLGGGVMSATILLLAACGGSSAPGDAAPDVSTADASGGSDAERDAGSGADVGGEAGRDATTMADGPAADAGLACGSTTCTGDDLCVTVSTCPGAVLCTDLPDGGSCPVGSNPMSCPTGRPGCVAICLPPTSSCKPRPAACSATISCSCITSTTCGGPPCISASGRAVFCAYQ